MKSWYEKYPRFFEVFVAMSIITAFIIAIPPVFAAICWWWKVWLP